MKKFKKLWVLFLTAVAFFQLTIPAFATTRTPDSHLLLNVTVSSEYEKVLEQTKEFQKNSSIQLNTNKSSPLVSYKEAFDKRAHLPESELIRMGYSLEDIQLIKLYVNGQIPFAQVAAATSAKLTTYFVCSAHSASKYIFEYYWSWDKLSISQSSDSCAIAVVGINSNSVAMVSSITSASSSITYLYNDGTMYQSSTIPTTKTVEGAYTTFESSKISSSGDRWVWAKKGSIRVVVVPAVSTGNFAAVRVAGEYARFTDGGNTPLSVTITINPSAGTIAFTFTLQNGSSSSNIVKLGYKQSVYRNDGSVTEERA